MDRTAKSPRKTNIKVTTASIELIVLTVRANFLSITVFPQSEYESSDEERETGGKLRQFSWK